MVIRNYLFHPQSQGCPSKTISQQLHFAIRQLSKSSSSEHQMIGPQWSFASTNNKVAFNFKESKCFVTPWLFSLTQPITVFSSHLSAPLNTNHLGLLRLICLLRISEGRHLQSRIIIILAPLFCKRFFLEIRFVLREHQLLFLLSNANKNGWHLFSANHLLKLSVLPLLWGVM